MRFDMAGPAGGKDTICHILSVQCHDGVSSQTDWPVAMIASSNGRVSMRKSFNQAIRRQSSWSWLPLYCVLVLAVCSDGARAGDDVIASPGDVQSGSLLLRMQEGYVIATRLTTDIRIDASGMAARVTLRQSFRNDGQSWVEGLYVFPLPEQSAVDRMRLYIGERYIEGEIREKEQAKK
jgi:hypothetical protein